MRLPQRPLFVIGSLCLAIAPVAGQRPAGFEPAWAEVRTTFHDLLGREGVVGGSLVFLTADSVLSREFHGDADVAEHRKVDANTIYHWASITKTLTGIAIMQLRDRGLLSLDDPIVRYVPELMAVHNPFGKMEAITIRQLMSHSSGFRNPTWPWGGDKPWQPFEPHEWSQLVAMMPYTEILFPPGSKFSYSNPGIIFLGRVIEKLTGDDFEVYIDKNILKPLGMYKSYFDVTPYHLLSDRSNNYTVVDGKAVANGLDFDTGITVSNGGLNAPLPDMERYLQFLLGNGPGAKGPIVVLKRSSLEEMWRPVLPVGEEGSIGLIFFTLKRDGRRFFGHTGSQRGFRSFFYIHPESRTGVIAVFNSAPPDEGPGHPDFGVIFDGLLKQLTATVFPLFAP